MVERHQVGGSTHAIDHELAVAERLPEREIKPVDAARPDGELVPLHDVVAVLVQRNRRDAFQRGDAVVVGDARDAVPHRAIRPNDLVGGLMAVGQAPPLPAVGVQVRALPGAAQA